MFRIISFFARTSETLVDKWPRVVLTSEGMGALPPTLMFNYGGVSPSQRPLLVVEKRASRKGRPLLLDFVKQ